MIRSRRVPKAHGATSATRISGTTTATSVERALAHVFLGDRLKVKGRLAREVFHAQVQDTKSEVGGSPAAPCLQQANQNVDRSEQVQEE